MKIETYHSHLNGWEHLHIQKPHLWEEIEDVISLTDEQCCTPDAKLQKVKQGRVKYSHKNLNKMIINAFSAYGWRKKRLAFFTTNDGILIRNPRHLDAQAQTREIAAAGYQPIHSYNQTDFVKERVAVEVQFGKYAFVAFDLFVKHMAFYVGDLIDVGVEILPMKTLQSQMSSGVPYYEGALYDLIREGRGVPAFPLVLVGIAP